MEIRTMKEEERKYTYRQSMQINGMTGYIGYLRGDFGSSGTDFFITWFEASERLKTDEFKSEFDLVINTLRSEEYGLLQDRRAMRRYVAQYKDSSFEGNYCVEYGFRVDTEKYVYLFRCNPEENDYNFYCFCYVSEHLDGHMKNAAKGIRFIKSNYEPLFKIPDGGKIVITFSSGEKREHICRYIDDCHTEVGSCLYHICQFAELMEQNGSVYEPAATIKEEDR